MAVLLTQHVLRNEMQKELDLALFVGAAGLRSSKYERHKKVSNGSVGRSLCCHIS